MMRQIKELAYIHIITVKWDYTYSSSKFLSSSSTASSSEPAPTQPLSPITTCKPHSTSH
jgi:hypothetical protein